MTLFDSDCNDGTIAGIWVIWVSYECVELSYCHDGMSVLSYLCSMTACGMISFGGLLSE